MHVGSCFGEDARKQIVRDYDLKLSAYCRMIPGRTGKPGCARPLTDLYYTFRYRCKVPPGIGDSGVFFCGYQSGEDFLKLLGLPTIPVFDPLASVSTSTSSAGAAATTSKVAMEPLNQELHNAINLFMAIRDRIPDGGNEAILDYLRRNPSRRTQWRYVDQFNNYLKPAMSSGPGTLLSEASAIPGLKTYDFPLIRDYLASIPTPNYYG